MWSKNNKRLEMESKTEFRASRRLHLAYTAAGRNGFLFPQPTCRQSAIYVPYFSRGSPVCRRQFVIHFYSPAICRSTRYRTSACLTTRTSPSPHLHDRPPGSRPPACLTA
ncbi:unnamed protein product [Boreogadus saida]